MSSLQKRHRTHGCQTNLGGEYKSRCKDPCNTVLMNLTTDITVIEEKLISQVAMDTEAACDEVGLCFFLSGRSLPP